MQLSEKMIERSPPTIYVIKNGRLVPKETPQSYDTAKEVTYSHTVRPSPDQYHTEAIKQYRREISELRKNYAELQRAYWSLMNQGETQVAEQVQKVSGDYLREVEKMLSEGTAYSEQYSHTLDKVKLFEGIRDSPQVPQALSVPSSELKLQLQTYNLNTFTDYQRQVVKKDQLVSSHRQRHRTEVEEDLEKDLMAAQDEIRYLKEILDELQNRPEPQPMIICEGYDDYIKRLQQILQRQRQNNYKLNDLVHAMRHELNEKQSLLITLLNRRDRQ